VPSTGARTNRIAGRDLSFQIATPADAPDLGRVHVACWRETYAGLLPDAFLTGLCPERRGAMWERMLSGPGAYGSPEVYLARANGRLLGFGCCELQRDDALLEQGLSGDFSSIYVLRSAQRLGIGSRLMREMARNLRSRGCPGAGLWVLRENRPARRFYERLGGVAVASKEDVRSTLTLVEIGYAWPNLESISGIAVA
jgi:ribosomal protein S18 acetylase RimI-like enzyme